MSPAMQRASEWVLAGMGVASVALVLNALVILILSRRGRRVR